MRWLIDLLNRILRRRVPPPQPVPSTDDVAQLLLAHNQVRGQRGLSALRLDARLCVSAQRVADACVRLGYLDHSADGLTPWQRIQQVGYSYTSASENLAKGQRTAEEVVQSWLADPPHAANVFGEWVDVGFARTQDVWAADYAIPSLAGG